MLELLASIATKRECGQRYTTQEKDMSLYRYMMAGPKYYQFMDANLPSISRSTLERHLKAHTEGHHEGNMVPVTLSHNLYILDLF